MRTLRLLALTLLAGTCLTLSVMAQNPAARQANDPGEMFARFFGKDRTFSASAHMTIASGAQGGKQEMDMQYALLDGKVRTEVDMSKMMSGGKNPQAAAHMKAMGMDRVITIVDSTKRTICMIYPSMKAYAEMTMPSTSAKTADATPPKMEKTEVGRETIDTHPCTKFKVTITSAEGKIQEAFVWEAKDLDGFPIQVEFQSEGGISMKMVFKQINTSKPEASLFTPPADFKHYGSLQEMMMGVMSQMKPGMGGDN